MQITILTLFPEMFQGPLDFSIVKNARDKKLVDIQLVNIRDFGIGKHKVVDDTPYGGGVGMVMRVDVLHSVISSVRDKALSKGEEKVVLLSADGNQFTQTVAKQFVGLKHLILVCGHYEGVDERIYKYVDEVISVGDFVVTGGEIPAMLITDAVTRLINGVLKPDATKDESFSKSDDTGNLLLEYPHYTRPNDYDGREVPQILLSGDHKKIALWRNEEAQKRTKSLRKDLLKNS